MADGGMARNAGVGTNEVHMPDPNRANGLCLAHRALVARAAPIFWHARKRGADSSHRADEEHAGFFQPEYERTGKSGILVAGHAGERRMLTCRLLARVAGKANFVTRRENVRHGDKNDEHREREQKPLAECAQPARQEKREAEQEIEEKEEADDCGDDGGKDNTRRRQNWQHLRVPFCFDRRGFGIPGKADNVRVLAFRKAAK